MSLVLRVRAPHGLVHEGPVLSVRVEERDGWIGILPGRRDVVGVLVPGLVLFEDDEGEGFVAIPGGLVDLHRGVCSVMAPEAELARDAEEAASKLAHILGARHERAAHRRAVLSDLEREALRRLARSLGEAR